MKKITIIILIIVVLVIIIIVGVNVYQNIRQTSEISSLPDYYQNLAKGCRTKGSYSCCKTSVDYMVDGNFKLIPEEGCPDGYKGNMLKCIDSYKWCEFKKETIPDVSYYQELFDRCEKYKGGNIITDYECCMGTAKIMQKNGYKLAPQSGCPEGFQVNSQWCGGAYGWCELVK